MPVYLVAIFCVSWCLWFLIVWYKAGNFLRGWGRWFWSKDGSGGLFSWKQRWMHCLRKLNGSSLTEMNALKHFSGERKNRLGVGEENWGLPVFSFCIYIKRKHFIKLASSPSLSWTHLEISTSSPFTCFMQKTNVVGAFPVWLQHESDWRGYLLTI